MHKGREVERRGAIELELVVNELVGCLGTCALFLLSESCARQVMANERTLEGILNFGIGVVP